MEDYSIFFDDNKVKRKSFNTTGVCNKDNHYMVNINDKLKEIVNLVQNNKYFVINKPRQYGKTTTLNELEKVLESRYKVIKLNFEGVGSIFESERSFCSYFTREINREIDIKVESVFTFIDLADVIKQITTNVNVILIIDEVDKTSNNKLFIDFLGILRSLFLSRSEERCTTFKSVILAGVHDIKNLKFKVRDGVDSRYNSPWNIAVKFDIDMSFNEYEIGTMLSEYSNENNLELDIENLSREIYKFTEGYPFLVSRICEIIDDNILNDRNIKWTNIHIQRAIKIILEENSTLFDDLIKNMENNKDLYEYMYNLLILNIPSVFNIDNPVINLGVMFGYLSKDGENNTIVSNKIIRERIYNYLVSKTDTKTMSSYNFKGNFITENNGLNMEKILLKFQQFMKENYSTKDVEFLERNGVLLFIAFIKPIINGVGFDYKEVQISEERRIDIVIQYNNHKYVIETKIWHGEVAHKKGLNQLAKYLDIQGLNKGYLLIFNFNKKKAYKTENINEDNKDILSVYV